MERYSTLWRMPENAYSPNSPIIARAGALLKDNETNNLLIQLKFENITENLIRSVKVKLALFDMAGKIISTDIEHQFLNLSQGYQSTFGQNSPIVISDFSVCSFEIIESIVMFDNFRWSSTQKYIPILTKENFLLNITEQETFNKFISATNHSIFWEKHQAEKSKINNAITRLSLCQSSNPKATTEKMNEYKSILHAERKADSDFDDNEKFLISNIEEALQLFETEKKEHKKEKSKKRRNIVIIAMTIIILAVTAFIAGVILLIINFGYNEAVTNLNNGYYEAAISDFEVLGSYRDCEEKILEAKFGLAEKMEEISITEAYNQYNKLPADYNGVKEKLEYLKPYLVYTETYNQISVIQTDGNGNLIDNGTSSNGSSITLNLCLKDGKLCYAPDALTIYNDAIGKFTYEYSEFSESEDPTYEYYCEYGSKFLDDYYEIYLSENALKIIKARFSLVSTEYDVITEKVYAK